MSYLKSRSLIHRDLAARNVLVQNRIKVLITDFGLSRLVQSDESVYEATESKVNNALTIWFFQFIVDACSLVSS